MCGLRLFGLSAGLAIAGLCVPLAGQATSSGSIEIRLASGTDQEQVAKKQLKRVLATWDLSRWLFTRIIEIQSGVIPHSQPVLTVNTQYLRALTDNEHLRWKPVDSVSTGAVGHSIFAHVDQAVFGDTIALVSQRFILWLPVEAPVCRSRQP